MKSIRISLQEERTEDSWFDLSLRELRAGEVRFYKASDLQTGQWLFKVCVDRENSRRMVKAKKFPGTHLVTLTKKDDEKEMITLFLLERARTLPPEERQRTMDLFGVIKEM